jgi:N-acetylglucosamine-6-phosphate deacetylase
MLPRHPNPIWELLASDAVLASFIVDGHHLPGSTVKAMVRAKSPQRSVLVTDAIAAAGCKAGRFTIGGVACELDDDGRVSLPGTPYLAGSALTMDRAIANVVRFASLPLEEAAAMASTVPAAYLGTAPAGTVLAEWDEARHQLRVLSVRE